MTYTLTFGRETWIGPDCCTFGDYGGYGSYGRANIDECLEQAGESIETIDYGTLHRMIEYKEKGRKPVYLMDELVDFALKLRERPDVIHVTGDYGSECVLIRQGWDWGKDTTDALEDYPCISEERVSEVEMQWEVEAWEGWLRRDLASYLGEHGSEKLENYFDSLDDAAAWQLYQAAMEASNTYPEAEHNGIFVQMTSVGPELLALVRSQYRDLRRRAIRDALETYHDGQYDFVPGVLPDPEGIGKAAAKEFDQKYA
jgi:hypothetical protein